MGTSVKVKTDTTLTWVVAVTFTVASLPLIQPGPVSVGRVLVAVALAALALVLYAAAERTRLRTVIPPLRISPVILGLIVATGIALRLRALFAARSLWFDEVSLATNIAERSLLDLLTVPLSFQQSAPPGFLTASWVVFETFGTGLLWVRAIPFVAGILTLIVGVQTARVVFRSFPAQVVFLAILAWSPILVFYATELKQYSTDVLAMTVALYLAHVMRQRRSGWLAAVLGFMAVVSSSAGIIVFFLLALIVLGSGFAKQRLRGMYDAGLRHVVALSAWLLGATVHVLYTVVAGVDRTYMQEYWRQRAGFAPQSLGSLEDVWWYGDRFQELVWLTFDATEMVGPGMHDGALWLVALVGVLVLCATGSAWRHNWPLQLAVLAFAMAYLLAMVGAYPFSSRLALYLIVALAFLVACGIDRLWASTPRTVWQTASLAAGLLMSVSLIVTSTIQFGTPFVGKDMHGALSVVVRAWQSGDAVWAVPLDVPVIEWHRVGAEFTAAVIPVDPLAPGTEGPIAALGENAPSRLWIVSSARRREARQLMEMAQPYYDASAVYVKDDTFIALLSNVGPVTFKPTGDRSLLRVDQQVTPANRG